MFFFVFQAGGYCRALAAMGACEAKAEAPEPSQSISWVLPPSMSLGWFRVSSGLGSTPPPPPRFPPQKLRAFRQK